jgi:hypothetical protein
MMAQRIEYVCDECGAVRKDANHWFVMDNSLPTILTVRPFTPENAKHGKHLCGEGCVTKMFARVMGTRLEAACVTK